MSLSRIKVVKLILREHFGEYAENIGSVLVDKGACHLRQIASETAFDINKVQIKVLKLIRRYLLIIAFTNICSWIMFKIINLYKDHCRISKHFMELVCQKDTKHL